MPEGPGWHVEKSRRTSTIKLVSWNDSAIQSKARPAYFSLCDSSSTDMLLVSEPGEIPETRVECARRFLISFCDGMLLGSSCSRTFVWELSLGDVRCRRSFAWDPRLGTFAFVLGLICGFGSLALDIWIGIFGLRCLAQDVWLGYWA